MSQPNIHGEIRPESGLEVWQGDQEPPGLSAARIQRQMDLILGSKHFRQAKGLENFLRYVVARKLAGAENELKEYTIGVEVFQRGADYDPRHDAVVRVRANLLRKRLAGYYQEEGARDELMIELPKGHYVPQFYLRPVSPVSVDLGKLVEESAPGLVSSLSVAASPRGAAPWLIAATFILGLLTAFAFQHWQGKRILAEKNLVGAPLPKVDPAYLPLWGKFFEPGVENLLAYGTPQFFSAKGIFLRDIDINSPNEARLISLRKVSHLDFKPTEIYTGVGETHGVYLLTRFFSKAGGELRVARSRMVGWNEMKNANVIFLSSMRFQTLAKELPYPSDFVFNPRITSAILNLRPGAGEPATYGADKGDEYAVLTVWPGKLHQRRIVILSGVSTWATLAAAEYVTDPEYLRQLNHHLEQCRLKTGSARHAPYFQTLLRAEVKDKNPISVAYVTHHDLQIADQIGEPAKLPNEEQVTMRRQ